MKHILVVAGTREQHQRYVRDALQEDDRDVFTYLSDERALRGVRFDDVVFVGEWWSNETFQRIGRDALYLNVVTSHALCPYCEHDCMPTPAQRAMRAKQTAPQ
jgi:hypothetical protein